MKGEIYIISEIWFDVLENSSNNAMGYKPIGFKLTKFEADGFCERGKIYPKSNCWAMEKPMPQYINSLLKRI